MDDKQRQHLESQLSAYLDNELSERERRDVDAFLAEDADARALLWELQATGEILRKLPRAKASERLQENLRGRLERDALLGRPQKAGETFVHTSFAFGWRSLAAAAVIVLTFGAAYLMGPFSRAPSSDRDRMASRDYTTQMQERAPTDGSADSEASSEPALGERDVSPSGPKPISPVAAEVETREVQVKEMFNARGAAPVPPPSLQLQDLAEDSKDESIAAARMSTDALDTTQAQPGQPATPAARELASQPSGDSAGLAQIQVPGVGTLPSAPLQANKAVGLTSQTATSEAATTQPISATSPASGPSE